MQFDDVSTCSQYYLPYLPGMKPGEVGLCTDVPGNLPVMPHNFIDTNYGGSGSAQAQSPAEYIPDVTVEAMQKLTFTWKLPQGFNPNQTLNRRANLSASTADGSTVFMLITDTGLSTQFSNGWKQYNGQDVGGTWSGVASADIAQHSSGSVLLQGKAESIPLPGTGQLALIKFGLSMSTVPSP